MLSVLKHSCCLLAIFLIDIVLERIKLNIWSFISVGKLVRVLQLLLKAEKVNSYWKLLIGDLRRKNILQLRLLSLHRTESIGNQEIYGWVTFLNLSVELFVCRSHILRYRLATVAVH